MPGDVRDLALFNQANGTKLRICDLAAVSVCDISFRILDGFASLDPVRPFTAEDTAASDTGGNSCALPLLSPIF
jgi:hypothetical protein